MLRSLLLSLVSHRTAATLRWDLHFLNVRMQARLKGVEASIASRIATAQRPLFLNLGSGPRGVDSPQWINIDGYTDVNVQHVVDFSRPLPIPHDSIDGIFSEHVQEHFTLEDGIGLLRECARILVPGGFVRVIMPDAEKILRTYFERPDELLSHRDVASSQPMEAVNSYFRQRYEHQCLYDFSLAKHALESAGFVDVARAGFQQGMSPAALMLDDQKYEWESLYVEGVKPSPV